MFPTMSEIIDFSVYYVQSRRKPESIATYPMFVVDGQKRVYWNNFIEGIRFTRSIPNVVHDFMPREYMTRSAVVLKGQPNRRGKYVHNIIHRGGEINRQKYLMQFMRRRGNRSNYKAKHVYND